MHDNIIQQLDENAMSGLREIETLYLLTSLSQIGKEYWLPEATLVRYFGIKVDQAGGYSRKPHLTHFSITVLLSYIQNKLRYDKLRSFLQQHLIEKLKYKQAQCLRDAEATILLLDMIVCPYIDDQTKTTIAKLFDIDAGELPSIQAVNDRWFTAWGNKFDLGKELDAKRSREVY